MSFTLKWFLIVFLGIVLPWSAYRLSDESDKRDRHEARLVWERDHMIQPLGRAPVTFRRGRIDWIRPAVWLRTNERVEQAALGVSAMYEESWRDAALELDTPKAKARRRNVESERSYLHIANGARMKVADGPAFPDRPHSRVGQIADGPHAGRFVYFDERLIRFEEAGR